MRIVFMGTPDLAAFCLESLIDAKYQVVGVVTAADKPAGRGRRIKQSPVKIQALIHGIPLLQPENLKAPAFISSLRALKPDLQVVVAFRMLPESVWALPPLGTFNVHASLLPDYRGAAPINWVLINGEKQTGVTTFLLDHQIDTGRILFREVIPIDADDNAASLHEKMKVPAVSVCIKTIEALASNAVVPRPQSDYFPAGRTLHAAPKIFKEHCRIDFNKSCHHVVNLIRGLSPQPGAFCEIDQPGGQPVTMKLFRARAQEIIHSLTPATFLTDNKSRVVFATPDGLVWVDQLQLPGKKIMETSELLRGFRFLNHHWPGFLKDEIS